MVRKGKGASKSRTSGAKATRKVRDANTTTSVGDSRNEPQESLLLLAALLEPANQRLYGRRLRNEIFPGDLKVIKDVLDDYWKKEPDREVPASKTTLRMMARKAAGSSGWKRIRSLVDEWLNTQPPRGRALEEHLSGYVRERGLYTLAATVLAQYERNPRDLDPNQVRKDLDALCLSWERDSLNTCAYSKTKGNGAQEDRYRCPTGIPSVDQHIRGGLGSGELGLVIAPPKHGKTTHLLNFAANAALGGKRVLHTTLEIHEDDVLERLDMCIGGYTGEEIRESPRRRLKSRGKVKKAGGEILVRDVSHEAFSIPRLAALLERHLPLGLLTIDYMALMKGERMGDRYEELGELARELRRLSARYSVPIWTAHQTTRAAIGMRTYDMSYLAESILPAHVCDVMLLQFQTTGEKDRGKARLKLECTRGSQDNPLVNLEIEYGKMQVREV